jgi:hypothetical protein
MYGLVRVRSILLQIQPAERATEGVDSSSILQGAGPTLVYQASDQPCFVNIVEMNWSSLYGDLEIALAYSTP